MPMKKKKRKNIYMFTRLETEKSLKEPAKA